MRWMSDSQFCKLCWPVAVRVAAREKERERTRLDSIKWIPHQSRALLYFNSPACPSTRPTAESRSQTRAPRCRQSEIWPSSWTWCLDRWLAGWPPHNGPGKWHTDSGCSPCTSKRQRPTRCDTRRRRKSTPWVVENKGRMVLDFELSNSTLLSRAAFKVLDQETVYFIAENCFIILLDNKNNFRLSYFRTKFDNFRSHKTAVIYKDTWCHSSVKYNFISS